MQTTSTLVTILLLTQITELKLLLELNSDHHRFYHLVLSALIVCIAAEVLLGVVTVYVTRDRFNRPLCQLSNNMTNEFFSIPSRKLEIVTEFSMLIWTCSQFTTDTHLQIKMKEKSRDTHCVKKWLTRNRFIIICYIVYMGWLLLSSYLSRTSRYLKYPSIPHNS